MNDSADSAGRLIIIAAPSGAGKSTLIQLLKKDFPMLLESISYTTRPPREGEKDGEHYFFISKAEFETMLEDNHFVEWAVVHSKYYGTSKTFVAKRLAQKKFILFDFDVQGADSLKHEFKELAQVIFIAPPDLETLEKRLIGRGSDKKEVILERLKNAKSEILRKNDFDYCVTNQEVDTAYAELKEIVANIVGGRV